VAPGGQAWLNTGSHWLSGLPQVLFFAVRGFELRATCLCSTT
jgi:hypothetical protein